MMLRRRLVAVAIAAAAFGGASGAAHASSASPAAADELFLRPTSGGELAYTTGAAEPFVAENVVVHYVTTGADAPPLNDDDANGHPDYVEQVAASAERALAFYAGRGFQAPLADRAGPDGKPDIYIKRLDPGILGLAVAHAFAEGGAFVAVSPRLDPDPKAALTSLSVTVAHELFHLVEFAYASNRLIPRWASEGAATAMALRAFPELVDYAALGQATTWLRSPWESLVGEGPGCERCYGSALWWLYLDRSSSDVLRTYLSRAGAAAKPLEDGGLALLDAILRQRRRASLAAVFNAFSVDVFRQSLRPSFAYSLSTGERTLSTPALRLAPLSTHYVRLAAPRTARGIAIAVPGERTRTAGVTLVLGGPSGRVVRATPFKGGGGAVVSAVFRSERERRNVLLVVTNGTAALDAYRVSAVAVGASGKLPGWIAWTRTG